MQRRLGTTRGSPRRSRTAKASRISRQAVKSRCAREWGGWGRVSDDGPGHYNPDPSEGPWGRWSIPPHGVAVIASTDPTLCGSTLKHEGRRQTDRRSADAGSRLLHRLLIAELSISWRGPPERVSKLYPIQRSQHINASILAPRHARGEPPRSGRSPGHTP